MSRPFIQPCIPTLAKEPPNGTVWMHEVKFDGYRCQLHKVGKTVRLYSRNGNDFTDLYQTVAEAAKTIPTTAVILDCELTVTNEAGTQDFSALLRRRHTQLCLWVFDMLEYTGKDLRPLPLWKRRQKLVALMRRLDSPAIRYSVIFDDPLKLLEACKEHGLEGIVSKRTDSEYRSGRSRDWLKIKTPKWREDNTWRHEFFGKQKT